MMNTKTMMALAIVAIVAVGSVAVLFITMNDGDDSGTVSGTTATVWLDWNGAEATDSLMVLGTSGSGEIPNYSGTGKTISDIVINALPSHKIIFASNGNITSVDGVTNTDTKQWIIFKWASPMGWSVFSDKSENYIDGMNIAVSYADRDYKDGSWTYKPSDDLNNAEITFKVYFFLQFKELDRLPDVLGAVPEWMEKIVENGSTTEEEMKDGIWIAGVGSNSNQALADAVLNYFFKDMEYEVDTDGSTYVDYIVFNEDGDAMVGLFKYGIIPISYGWHLSFFGMEDTDRGSDDWIYWSQYVYHPDAETLDDLNQWSYNQRSFGLYDITEYRYFALVLQTTGSSEDDDYFIPIPTPSTIPDGL